jgi:Colicin E5 ribonuclease domain
VGITGIPDQRMFDAIKSFQRMNNLRASGITRPDDETLRMMNLHLEARTSGLYIWRSVEDDKVRKEHAQYNRTLRDFSHSPAPGEDSGCRCWAAPFNPDELDDPPIERVYPEEFLIPLMGVVRLYRAWKAWQNAKSTIWTLGTFKSSTRWGNQLKNRDWTPEQITKTLEKGRRFPAPNKVNKRNKATRYELDGRYVVKDNITNEILQISGSKFKANKMP